MFGMSPPPPPSRTDRFPSFWAAWSVVLSLIIGFEVIRWENPETRTEALTSWLCGVQADWLPYLPVFLLGAVLWQVRGRRGIGQRLATAQTPTAQPSSLIPQPLLHSLISVALGLFAVGVAAWTGWEMSELPPAYHDEFSYLFQSLTFLDGRTSFPSFEPLPQLFDQMHVLNERRFASRYFPGAGAWFALFHGVGSIWGLWIAHGIVTTGASIVAGEIAGRTARVVAGLAAAFSPGLCLFSQLYLAHLPTLVGLTLFLVAILRLRRLCEASGVPERPPTKWLRYESLGAAFFAGCGLSFAMLCRPMTAAGVGLPFGVWLFWWVGRQGLGPRAEGLGREEIGQGTSPPGAVRSEPSFAQPSTLNAQRSPDRRNTADLRLPLAVVFLMALPILAGIVLQLAYNHSITGKVLVSPYQLYTDIYTPRHGYGFNNVVRGEQDLGPKVLDNYDRWAENLTLPRAIKKMGIRIVASGRWTLGLVPLAFVVVLLVWNWRRWNGDLKLIVASIVSLHLVHLPYWFEGIMGWHYVFESAPLWAIVLGVVTTDFAKRCRETGHGALRWWWVGVLLTSLATAWLTVPPLWPGRLPVGLIELQFPRQKYARFDELLQSQVTGPAIIFIRPDPSDRHIDYVYNRPQLDSSILRARAPASQEELQQAIRLFPDRTPWLYDASSRELLPWRTSTEDDNQSQLPSR